MSKYAKPVGYTPTYGTAGFRTDASLLESTVYRCGALMALRAAQKGAACGIMITASHNKESDNGVKLVDANGEMIPDAWEEYATRAAQAATTEEFAAIFDGIASSLALSEEALKTARVHIGYDTRPSSPHLANVCREGVRSVAGAEVGAYLPMTTPELHDHVYAAATGRATSYLDNLIATFKSVVGAGTADSAATTTTDLYVDCANGIGACKLAEIQERLAAECGLRLHLFNTGEGQLNHMCGADYVEKDQAYPVNLEGVCGEGTMCCSLDGDADRIVYFTKRDGKFCLLNGDRIAILMAAYLCNHANVQKSVGLVQTAYANGASTQYIRTHLPKVHVGCAPTGVKHLHKVAKKYDIGIYFEANGHGTVLFKDAHTLGGSDNPFASLLSQVTGDAIGNLLAVQAIAMTCPALFGDWLHMYDDLPCKQVKVKANRAMFETTDAERKCVRPLGLQSNIDEVVNKYESARCFVRPSGTEDAVRVYVEARRGEDVDAIASAVVQMVEQYC